MNKIRLLSLLLLVILSCTNSDSMRMSPKNEDTGLEEYLRIAKETIEEYRVPDDRDFYGFKFGKKFEGADNHPFSVDERTGGRFYRLRDKGGVFDEIALSTDNSGRVLDICLLKEYDSYDQGMNLFNVIVDKFEATYPCVDKGNNESLSISYAEILIKNNDNEWLEWYSEKLKYSLDYCYILHPTLHEIKCILKRAERKTGVMLIYKGKEYVRMEESQNEKLKEKLGEL